MLADGHRVDMSGKRTRIMGYLGVVVLVVILAGLAARFMVNPAEPRPFNNEVRVDPSDLRRHVEELTGLGGFRSAAYPAVLDRARQAYRRAAKLDATGRFAAEIRESLAELGVRQ